MRANRSSNGRGEEEEMDEKQKAFKKACPFCRASSKAVATVAIYDAP